MDPNKILYLRPRILVSPCLHQVACRYDGTANPCPAVDDLAPWVELVGLCPEVEAGLPVPRPPMQYILQGKGMTLRQGQIAPDLLPRLVGWAESRVKQLPPLAGGIFKARSPSCALDDCKLHQETFDGPVTGQRPGFFVQALRQAQPSLALISEEGLINPVQRTTFFIQVFVLARYQTLGIKQFLTQHALWLLLYDNPAGPLHQAARTGLPAFAPALQLALQQPPQQPRVAELLAQRLGIATPEPMNPGEFSRWGQGLVLKYGKKFPWISLIFYPFPKELR